MNDKNPYNGFYKWGISVFPVQEHGKKPTCRDIGILGSTDILAIDKASVDLVYSLPESERRDLVERIESRSGLRQLEYMLANVLQNPSAD